MAKILAVKPIITKSGSVRVLVTTGSKDHWIPFGQWKNKCHNPLESYIGGNIETDYYKAGDEMTNGENCTDDDKVLRDFIASINPEVAAIAQATTAQRQMEDLEAANALFKRNKAEKTVPKEASSAPKAKK